MSHTRETANRPEENGKDAKEEQAKTRDGERGKDGKSNGKNAGGGGGDDGFAAKRKDTAKKVGRQGNVALCRLDEHVSDVFAARYSAINARRREKNTFISRARRPFCPL